jgi:ATP-dependent RNA helicase RhlE
MTDLHPLITRNLEQMGYAQPRAIQQAARQPILDGRDVIGLAQTGTGKTAAFAAPLLHHLLSHRPMESRRPIRPEQRLRALILCPTRELAQQVQRECGVIAQGTALRTACVFGKASIAPQAQAIARGIDLLVGTPGRVIELLEEGMLSLAHVRGIVIDEGDRMLDMGFLPQVRRILERAGGVHDGSRKTGCQILLFSATMPPAMEDLARTFMHDPVRLEIGRHTTPVSHVQQHLIPVDDAHKVEALLHLLGVGSPTIGGAKVDVRQAAGSRSRRKGVLIFCRTRRRVGWVGTALERHGIKVGMIHGDRSQAQRQKALDRFKDGEAHVLVATDVAARGLHIPAVNTVINYDLPLQPEEYVHRIGRAAHGIVVEAAEAPATFSHSQERENVTERSIRKESAAQRGQAFTLLDPDDRLHWRSIVDATNITVFAEHEIDGWRPPESKTSRRTAGPGLRQSLDDPKQAQMSASARERRERPKNTRRRKGRSHASAPIRKGQKPGGGVKRLG